MRAIVLTLLSLMSLPVFAGGYSVGNGGVIWACMSNQDRVFHHGMLADLHEGRLRKDLEMIADPGGDPMALYRARKEWLARELPEMFTALKTRFERVESILAPVDAVLESTKDFNFVLKPTPDTCPQGEWKARNIANFNVEDGKVYLDKALWNSSALPTLDKAALLFHEAIYYWTRSYYAHTTSDKARALTALLFSKTPAATMKTKIAEILGAYPDQPEGDLMCVMMNNIRNQAYVAYGTDQADVEFTVNERCTNDPDAHFCSEMSLSCEKLGVQRVTCITRNAVTNKQYRSQGRSTLEAQFNAHMACFTASQAAGTRLERHCDSFEQMRCK